MPMHHRPATSVRAGRRAGAPGAAHALEQLNQALEGGLGVLAAQQQRRRRARAALGRRRHVVHLPLPGVAAQDADVIAKHEHAPAGAWWAWWAWWAEWVWRRPRPGG